MPYNYLDPAAIMYHGTSADFSAPDPALFNNQGLYGPGYYLTADPRVASSYAGGPDPVSEQLLKELQQDMEHDLRLSQSQEYDINTRAQAETNYWNTLNQINDMMKYWESGANVRQVDVPPGLNLLDMDSRVSPEVLAAIEGALKGNWQDAELLWGRQYGLEHSMTGDDLYYKLTQLYGKDLTNQILADAGYHGIRHEGGNRVPLVDAEGNDIYHDVNVIFPESLKYLRNISSGGIGGYSSDTQIQQGWDQDADWTPERKENVWTPPPVMNIPGFAPPPKLPQGHVPTPLPQQPKIDEGADWVPEVLRPLLKFLR